MRSTQIPQWIDPYQDLALKDVLFKCDLPEALGISKDYVDNISGKILNDRYRGLALPKPRILMPAQIRIWTVKEMELWLRKVQRARPGKLPGRALWAYPGEAWDDAAPGDHTRA